MILSFVIDDPQFIIIHRNVGLEFLYLNPQYSQWVLAVFFSLTGSFENLIFINIKNHHIIIIR